MSTPFRQHRDVLSKSPAAAHGLDGRSPASAEEGGLLFGDFLLAIQEKATRAPKAHESSCFKGRYEMIWMAISKRLLPARRRTFRCGYGPPTSSLRNLPVREK